MSGNTNKSRERQQGLSPSPSLLHPLTFDLQTIDLRPATTLLFVAISPEPIGGDDPVDDLAAVCSPAIVVVVVVDH